MVLLDPAGDRYGASRFTAALAEEVARQGACAEIWVPFDHGIGTLVRSPSVSVRIAPVPVLRRGDWRGARRAAATATRMAADALRVVRLVRAMRDRVAVVHAVTLASVAGPLVARTAGVPLHWSVHETVRSARERDVFRVLLAGADRLYACSSYVAGQFPTLPMTVAHTGTHLVDGELPASSEPMSTGAAPCVVCVGRVNHWKGQDVLLEALAALAAGGVSFTCRLVGSAFPGDEHLVARLHEQVAAAGLTDRVCFDGEVDDAREAMASADVVVVPSKVPEPFGKVVVEAMAVGRPVVATTPGGPAEVIRSGVDGVLVPTGDVPALTAALRDLLQDPAAARRLGRAAAERARLFSEAAAVRAVAADLLTSRGPG
ncbi:hypothetical protein DQ238_19980 [Geodermatophilus sp. TF02-6]|uniref:glycosyltransferase family 4 protein n=1 Tax=Geodermatophilus sp. TF02-6 TaxID=2250575 RepID=UPI000DFB289F|nr:glycosyltransferase family 4 protein [Geodermatophilus sp. TF02-6]RBY75307.1 hypothetical protein DQ238_19980 [Geodermatophilus sp. TF02-6]